MLNFCTNYSENISYSLCNGHDILAIYCVSTNVWLSTRKTGPDLVHKLCIWGASRVAKQLETYDFTKLKNIFKKLKTGWGNNLVTILLSEH